MRAHKVVIVAALITVVGLAASFAGAMAVGPALAQDEPESSPPPPVAVLELGQRFAGPGWDLEVQDAFVVPSPVRTGWSEVKVGVAFRPTAVVLPYLLNGLAGEAGYPVLALRDGAGELRVIPETDPITNLVPGSTLSVIPPGVPARWTVGFEVPTAFTSELSVEASENGVTFASWDLRSSRSALGGWEPLPGLAITEFNEPIPWSDDLEVTPVDHTVQVCGDPETQQVTVGYGLVVRVTNNGVDDAPFPDVLYPQPAGVAVWTDGSSARYSTQFFIQTEDVPTDPLRSESIERVMIPPRTTFERVMTFIVPRDGRFVNEAGLPAAVILAPPAEVPVWVDLGAKPGSDFVFLDCGDVLGGHAFDVDQDGEVVQPAPVVTTTTTIASQ